MDYSFRSSGKTISNEFLETSNAVRESAEREIVKRLVFLYRTTDSKEQRDEIYDGLSSDYGESFVSKVKRGDVLSLLRWSKNFKPIGSRVADGTLDEKMARGQKAEEHYINLVIKKSFEAGDQNSMKELYLRLSEHYGSVFTNAVSSDVTAINFKKELQEWWSAFKPKAFESRVNQAKESERKDRQN